MTLSWVLLPLATLWTLWRTVRSRAALVAGFAAADRVVGGFWLPNGRELTIGVIILLLPYSDTPGVRMINPMFIIFALLLLFERCFSTPGRQLEALRFAVRAEFASRSGVFISVLLAGLIVIKLFGVARQ